MFGNERPMRPASANPRKPILPVGGCNLVRPQSAPIGYHNSRTRSVASTQPSVNTGSIEAAEVRRRRYFFSKPTSFEEPRYFDVTMDAGDTNANFPNHLTFSYADFLSDGPIAPLVQADGKTVDIRDMEKFLLETKPRTWRDAYPLYVLAKHALKAHYAGTIHIANGQLAELTARAKAAEEERVAAVAKAELFEKKYNILAKNTKSSYLGLTADFDRRQAATREENEKRGAELEVLRDELAMERAQNEERVKKLEAELAGMSKKFHKTELVWRDKEIARLTTEVEKLEAAAAETATITAAEAEAAAVADTTTDA